MPDTPDLPTPGGGDEKIRTVRVNVCGQETLVAVHDGWTTIAPVTTKARWQTGCGDRAFDNFEVRDERGTLLQPDAALGEWLDGRTLYVNLLAGIGA